MSYQEAVEDGIMTIKTGKYEQAFYPPCAVCGIPTFSKTYSRGRRYMCTACKLQAVLPAWEKREKAEKRTEPNSPRTAKT